MMMDEKEEIGLKHIIIYYLHHWKVFMTVFAVSLVFAILYLVMYPKTYEMFSTVQIQDDKDIMSSGGVGLGEAAGLMKSFGLGGASGGGINIDDELNVLKSNNLLNKVVLQLGLNVEYHKPYTWSYKFYDDTPLTVTADSVTFAQVNHDITLQVKVKKDKVKVSATLDSEKVKFEYSSLPAIIKLKQGSFVLDYAESVKKEQPNVDMEITIRPSRWVAEEILDELVVDEYSKISNVIEMTWRDYEKNRGLDLLNAIVENYNNRAGDIKKEEGQKALLFLNNRIDSVMSNLADIEEAIVAYKTKNKLTDLKYDIQFYAEQVKDIQSKVIETEAQTHVIDMLDSYVKDPENKYNVIPSLLSIKESDKNSAISLYNEALIERSRLLQNSNEDNPLVGSMDKRISQLRKGVFLSIANARKGLGLTVSDLKKKENIILNKMSSVPSQEREYIDYKRQQEILQGVYLILLQKREEIALALGSNKAKARVVEQAYVKKKPVKPRKLFAAIGMCLVTLLIPVGYLFGKEQLLSLWVEYKRVKNKE